MMAGFRREVDGNCPFVGYYTACSGDFLRTFRDNLSVQYLGVRNLDSWSLKMGPIGCPETSVRYYNYWLC